MPQDPRFATPGRRHDLDALRAVAMLLGIVLHGALSYVTWPFWPVHDTQTSPFFDLLFSAIHGFRMPLFFMMSGFFTAMLWRKRGIRSLLKQRALRILLPLVIFLPLLWLLTGLVFGAIVYTEENATAEKSAQEETIWKAAKTNDLDALKKHIAEAKDIDARDPKLQIPPLNWAALAGNLEAAQLLLDADAQVDSRSGDNTTPLSSAAFYGHADLVALFLEHGADPNTINHHNSTSLDNAHVDWGIVAMINGLLGLDADRESVEEGRKKAIKLLREAGGKRRAELAGGAARKARKSDGIAQAYLDFARAPVFQGDYLMHLWFLWFLIVLLVPFALYAKAIDATGWGGFPRRFVSSPLALLVLVPITAAVGYFHGLEDPTFGPDSSGALAPKPHVLLYHGIFFFFGAFYFDADDQDGALSRGWWLMLPLALLAIFPAGLHATFETAGRYHALTALLQALFVWLMIFGLMGLFRKICSSESKALRYISDSSYFLYLLHIPLVFAVQHWVKALDLSVFIKFALTCTSLTVGLLCLYELVIRYTFIGTMLNGKRYRNPRPKAG